MTKKEIPINNAAPNRMARPIKAAFCFRLMVAMTGAPQCGHVRAWSLTCPLHSWHWMGPYANLFTA
jgi:hypothetical protein